MSVPKSLNLLIPKPTAGGTAGHFILQAEQAAGGGASGLAAGPAPLAHARAVPPRYAQRLRPPAFRLAGLAIGNGLTDPASQVC